VRPPVGSVGDCYDNAMAERVVTMLEWELIHCRHFHAPDEAHLAMFEYIEGWYIPHRRHSASGYRSPLLYGGQYEPASTYKLENIH
jgi:putative transposase